MPQPSPFQNLMGALGVTWGRRQDVAGAEAARLDEDRQRKQQAYVWGPLYKKANEVFSADPTQGADKVMRAILGSEEWMNAASTPGFDHQNAGKNLTELVRGLYPQAPNLIPMPQNSSVLEQQPSGTPNAGQVRIAGQGQQKTDKYNRANEKYGEDTTPAQAFNQGEQGQEGAVFDSRRPMGEQPTLQGGGKLGAAQAAQGAPAETPAGVSNQPPSANQVYEAPDGSDADGPVMPWKIGVNDIPDAGLKATIDEAAFQYGITPDAFASQIWKESRFKSNALGKPLKDGDRAYGLGQIKGSTWKGEIAPELGFSPMDINDPVKNVTGAAYYMGKLLRKYNGDYTKALMAYNWGQGKVDKWDGDWGKVPDETVDYVMDITNGNVNIPQGLGGAGPNVRTRRAIINKFPDDRPASVDDVNRLVQDRKEYMFLGAGFVPWFKNLVARTSRQLDPTLAKGDDNSWMEVVNTNRNNLKFFRYQLSKLNRSGDQRLAVLANAAMDLFPEDLTQDPMASVQAAIDLYRNLAKEYEANEAVTVANSSEGAVKEAMMDNERIMGVIRALPSLAQMVDLQKLIREGDIVQSPGGMFSDLGHMVGQGWDYATRDVVNGLQNASGVRGKRPAGGVSSTAPVVGQQGGPQIPREIVRGQNGRLRFQ